MKDDMLKSHCKACESGVGLLDSAALQEAMRKLTDWQLADDQKSFSRVFEFKNFYKTMAFVNAVAWIANREDHHPDLEVGYSRCKVTYSTHSAGGITDNDLICAAAIDKLSGDE
jgi:4a-hydroxytetrahydrobiopterin dehydratase